ncbi:MAG: RNA polymerase sigma factor [Saprospiraceae bacterium]|nr:RNA polymerase sigma factor [Saprospiraceae bacterium]
MIAGCKQNNRTCQELLYKYFFKECYDYCSWRIKNDDETMSVINDAWLKIFKSIHQLESIEKFKSWAFTILKNTSLDHIRKNMPDWEILENLGDVSVPKQLPSDQVFLNIDMERMLKKLPETTRDVFVHFALDGYAHEEIARKFNITESTSRWHVANARKILQKIYWKENE